MILVNNHLLSLNRVENSINETGLRLHSSERDQPFGEVWEKFINSITQEDIRYYPNLSIAYTLLERFLNIDKKFLTLGEGSDRIIKNIFECFSIKGYKVLSTNPCFPMYEVYSKIHNIEFEQVNYIEPKFPLDSFLKKITKEISLVMISNPSSPVGDVLSFDEIRLIADRCKKIGIVLAIDEAYIEFSNITSVIDLIHVYDIIVIRTFSKAQGAAGIRLGYCISNENIKEYIRKVQAMNPVSGLAIKWLETYLNFYDKEYSYVNNVKLNRDNLFKLLDGKIEYIKSSTNYINILGDYNLKDIRFKKFIMPWNNMIYTRFSIPSSITNFEKLNFSLNEALGVVK